MELWDQNEPWEEECREPLWRRIARTAGIALAVAFIFVAGGIAALLWESSQIEEYEIAAENAQTLSKLALLMEYIDYYYLYETDKEAMADILYEALVASLGDPYSGYYTEAEYASFKESSSGQYYGIGVSVVQDAESNEISVVTVFRNSPAAEAGICVGDILKEVAGESIADCALSEVVAEIKGELGTTIELTFYRPETEQSYTVTVERGEVSEDTVFWEMLEEGIGYLQLTGFEEVSSDQFAEALADLQEQGMLALILDLRDNPGGDLESVLSIAEQLLPEGVILTIDYSVYGEIAYSASGENEIQIPVVVLVNGSTASAAEVLTGALQDYEKAVIVGTQTYGKGIVQTIFPIGDGTAIKLTVADYYTPSGRSIHGIGITPDVVVEQEEEGDVQLEMALAVARELLEE